MQKRSSLHRSVIERFTEKQNTDSDLTRDETNSDVPPNQHFRRFMKMVQSRKQLMLERILMDKE